MCGHEKGLLTLRLGRAADLVLIQINASIHGSTAILTSVWVWYRFS